MRWRWALAKPNHSRSPLDDSTSSAGDSSSAARRRAGERGAKGARVAQDRPLVSKKGASEQLLDAYPETRLIVSGRAARPRRPCPSECPDRLIKQR